MHFILISFAYISLLNVCVFYLVIPLCFAFLVLVNLVFCLIFSLYCLRSPSYTHSLH